jgi:hypothetical protein
MENTRLNEKDALIFSTDKIIIEDLSKSKKKLIYHFLIKIENPTDKLISLPIVDMQNQRSQNETMFYLEINGKIYSTVSYLNRKGNENLYLNAKDTNYVLLSLAEKINRDDIQSGFINYMIETKTEKKFPIINTNTERIITDHRINIEEAIKLVHGMINGKQY